MADVFQYRECRATITARTPDTPDADQHPDRVLVQGRGTAHPQFQGGSVVFTEIGEYAIPQPIPVVIVDGELLVEVLSGDETVTTQPLFLPVTVDERANQNWSWRLVFDFLTLGEYGEEVKHPPLSFPVEAGDGPLEISTVATPVIKSQGFVTRGAPGPGLQEITAENGEIVFHWDNGNTASVPVPDAVPGPPGPMVDVTAGTVEVGATPTDFGVSVTGEGEARQINVMLPKPEKGDPGRDGIDGVNPDIHELDEYVMTTAADVVEENLNVVEVARNLVPNPLLPDSGTVAGWTAASPTQANPVWDGDRLRFSPTVVGTNVVSPSIHTDEGATVTVSAWVQAAVGTSPRLQITYGGTVTGATLIATTVGQTHGGPQLLTVAGELPADQSSFRIGLNPLSQAGDLTMWSVTTTDEAFDGYSVPETALDEYRWLGAPYASPSVHVRGGLRNSVLSDVVRNVVIVDEPPASSPDQIGTLFIAPAARVPIFTDFLRGLDEIVPRWDKAAAWTSGQTWVGKEEAAGQRPNRAFALAVANQAVNCEVVVQGQVTSATTLSHGPQRFGPVLRGLGETSATAHGISATIDYNLENSAVTLVIREHQDGTGTVIAQQQFTTGMHNGIPFWVRLRAQDDMVFAKAWKHGDTEPLDWMLAAQTSILNQGWIGGRTMVPGEVRFNRMGVSFDQTKAPGAY